MFYNLKNKIKKGIIFLLSALQIGALSGCMNDNVSKEEYEESLKKIEQLENDIDSLEEENSKLEKDNNSLEESIDKITKEKEDLEKRNEQLEKEVGGLRASSSLLAVPFPIDVKEPFNIDLANKIGISEDVLSDENVKNMVNEFNTYINTFKDGIYYIKYYDYSYYTQVKNSASIFYFVNGQCIGEVNTLDENKNTKWLYFSYYKDNVTFSNTFKITDNKIEMCSNNYSWVYKDNYYYVSYTNYNDSSYIEIDSFNPTSEDKNLFIQLYQDEDNKYTLNINNDYPNFDSNEPNYIGFEISEEDFQTLNNLILTYLENKQNENIINYCKDALFDIFEKYGKGNELQKYINTILNDQKGRILK